MQSSSTGSTRRLDCRDRNKLSITLQASGTYTGSVFVGVQIDGAETHRESITIRLERNAAPLEPIPDIFVSR